MSRISLRNLYGLLKIIEERGSFKMTAAREERIKGLKKQIREELRKVHWDSDKITVRDDGDSFVVRYPVPRGIDTVEEAKEWFEDYEFIHMRPSPYDCTGQRFTAWYEFHKLQGRLWVWHSIALDV
jgi:hypothetical protein